MWWKKNKWKVLLPVLTAALLAAAFWYDDGGAGTPRTAAGTTPSVVEERVENPMPVPQPPEETEAEGQPSSGPDLPGTADKTDDGSRSDRADEAPSGPEEKTEERGEEGSDGQGGTAAPDTGAGKYPTEPTVEPPPAPVEPQDSVISDRAYTCTISISCAAILEHMDRLDPGKAELVPEDGWVLEPIPVTFFEGESVFQVLQRTCKEQGIHLEFENTPLYNSAYIEGIHNLYEFDCGELSGWMYRVNGWFPNYGCSRYQLSDGDEVCLLYTCDLGADIGGSNTPDGPNG